MDERHTTEEESNNREGIQKLVIGAPFGNYLHFPHTTPTLGTFTSKYRGGFWKRVWRVLKTVRYYPGIQAWKNKLGLPNPGVEWLSGKTFSDAIISVMGFTNDEWLHCVRVALSCKPLAIELNVSCPNCPGEDKTDYETAFQEIKEEAGEIELIVKLPPVGYEERFEYALYGGINSFHCCNTLPTPGGGLSGKPLKLLSLACAEHIAWSCLACNVPLRRLIGGGGVTHLEDALDYLNAGCTNVSVATVLFNFFNWRRIKQMALDLGGWDARRSDEGTARKMGIHRSSRKVRLGERQEQHDS